MNQNDNDSQSQETEDDSLGAVSKTFSSYCLAIPLGHWCDIKLDISGN